MSHCRDLRPQDQNEVLIGGGSITIDIAKNWVFVTGHRVQRAENQVQSTPVAQEGQEVRETDRTIAIHVGWAGSCRTTRAPSGQKSNQVVEINVPVGIHVSGDGRWSLVARQCGQGKTVHRRLDDRWLSNIRTDESDLEG